MNTPLIWEQGWCFNNNHERVYSVHIQPGAGRITLYNPPQQTEVDGVHIPAKPSSMAGFQIHKTRTRGLRARRKVVDFSVHHRLHRFCTFTFREEPDPEHVHQALKRTLRSLQRRAGLFPWVAAPQGGELLGRPHIHFLCPKQIDRHTIEKCWSSGFTHIHTTRTANGIRRTANYLCHDFLEPCSSRAWKHRYWIARGFELPPPMIFLMTIEEIESWLSDHGAKARWWHPSGDFSFVQQVAEWDPISLT